MNPVYLKRATISSRVICFVNTLKMRRQKLKEVPGGGGYRFLISTENSSVCNEIRNSCDDDICTRKKSLFLWRGSSRYLFVYKLHIDKKINEQQWQQ